MQRPEKINLRKRGAILFLPNYCSKIITSPDRPQRLGTWPLPLALGAQRSQPTTLLSPTRKSFLAPFANARCMRWWVVRRQQGAINRYRRHCRRFAPCRSKRTIRAVIANAVAPAICSGCSHLFSMPSLCSFFCFPFFRHLVSLRLLNILAYLFSSRCTLGTAWLPWQTRC